MSSGSLDNQRCPVGKWIAGSTNPGLGRGGGPLSKGGGGHPRCFHMELPPFETTNI